MFFMHKSTSASNFFYEDIGLAITPSEDVIGYDGYFVEELFISVPRQIAKDIICYDGCNNKTDEAFCQNSIDNNFGMFMNDILISFPNKIDENTLNLRKKFNKYRIDEKIAEIKTNRANLLEDVENIENWTLDDIAKIQNKHNIVIAELLYQTFKTKKRCTTSEFQYWFITFTIWFNKFRDTVNSALSNEITPAMLPSDRLKHIVKNRNDLKDTVYEEIPELIYKLGSFSVLYVNNNPFVMGGLITMPKIFKNIIGVVLQVNKVNFKLQNENLILKSPEYILKTSQNEVWVPNFKHCSKANSNLFSILMCPLTSLFTTPDPCLEGVIRDDTIKDCSFETYRFSYSKVIRTSYGIIAGAGLDHYFKKNQATDESTYEKEILNPEKVHYLNEKGLNSVIINGIVYREFTSDSTLNFIDIDTHFSYNFDTFSPLRWGEHETAFKKILDLSPIKTSVNENLKKIIIDVVYKNEL